MAVMNVKSTRTELTDLKKKLVIAHKGHKLLKDKCDELMRQLLILAEEKKELRSKIEVAIKNANELMALSYSSMSDEELSIALMGNNNSAEIEVNAKNIAGVDVPAFSLCSKRFKGNDVYPYGFAFTSGALDSAVEVYNDIFPDMIRLAETEKSIQRLSCEVQKTRRRVNVLEHIIIPQYEDTIRHIAMRLQENERDNITRAIKFKDMIIESYR